MSTEIKAPVFPESVAEGTVATWHKQPGEACSRDELIVDIETDKVVLEVVAPADGVIEEILKNEGDTVESGEVVGKFKEGAKGESKPAESKKEESKEEAPKEEAPKEEAESDASSGEAILSPAARKLAEENNVDPNAIKGTGKDGRVTKEDVQNHVDSAKSSGGASAPKPAADMPEVNVSQGERPEKRVPMTRLRASIAKRLVNAQQSAAMLTTFNEVNMAPIMELRKQYQDSFVKRHGIKLGFMSFFTKAATEALKRFPAVNASIDGNDMVYHGYQDIGVAVSTDRGLVVPVLRDSDAMGLADIEKKIVEYGTKAKEGKLAIEDMTGALHHYQRWYSGSLISTPILNPPQTAILGMHKIQERPMMNGKVEIQRDIWHFLTTTE